MKLYHLLVNRQPGIAWRYHRMHDRAGGVVRILSWGYLLWLNFCYYCLFCRFIGRLPEMEKAPHRMPVKESESERFLRLHPELDPKRMVETLSAYDVISFDIFDTLLIRPFGEPTDLFYLIGEKIGVSDFKERRMLAEKRARLAKMKQVEGDKTGDIRAKQASDGGTKRQEGLQEQSRSRSAEVTLKEIWERLSGDICISIEEGMRIEIEAEERYCKANPLMLAVWEELKRQRKRLIVTTDMYLPKDAIQQLLAKNGFTGFEALFVSCEYGKSKADGTLFDEIRIAYPSCRLIHVGDDPHSDERMAKKQGLNTFLITNGRKESNRFRTRDMSAIVGSAWRGIVGMQLYSGERRYSMLYEYGFVCGGLFVLGYCTWIHRICRERGIDCLLFLSRDGEVLKEVYDRMYPDEDTAYVYWSRKAAAKLAAGYDRTDYFERFIHQKTNRGITIRQVLASMELESMQEKLLDPETIRTATEKLHTEYPDRAGKAKNLSISAEELLTDRNSYLLQCLLECQWDEILEHYRPQREAAGRYYGQILFGAKKAAAVDVGWAGSGALALCILAEHEWKISCEILGIVAGTNSAHNMHPDASEAFLQSGILTSYMFSQSMNRDLWRMHDPARGYNLFFELLLSSEEPSFSGFYLGDVRRGPADQYLEDMDITLCFGNNEGNPDGISEIRQGILDFAKCYADTFAQDPYLFEISGRDAYAPMLAAAAGKERYLHSVLQRFHLHELVD